MSILKGVEKNWTGECDHPVSLQASTQQLKITRDAG